MTSLRMELIFDLQRCEAATRRQVAFNAFVVHNENPDKLDQNISVLSYENFITSCQN